MLRRPSILIVLAALVLLVGSPALALGTLTGADSMTDAFDPNNTSPHLELNVDNSALETPGGVSLSESGTFDLDIGFKDNGGEDFFDNLILTAALDSTADNSAVEITVIFGGTVSVSYAAGDFTDAQAFGLPLPPGGIRGIAYGEGDYLNLDGAEIVGFDLMAGLERDVVDFITVSIIVSGLSTDGLVRFDIFGLDASGNVIGNNPNSGAAGVIPEPNAALLFGIGSLLLGFRLRDRS